MLEKITSPKDIKGLNKKELDQLSEEIRQKVISTVSRNGGHLASNLGAAELTIALHRVFDMPADKLLFDVGHQCYAHKLLTGRVEDFHTIRTYGGLSGFTNRFESEYDAVTAGHSGPSLSAAIGIAAAVKLEGRDDYTLCVIGDGSFTNGMVYEALNNCDDKSLKLIIILNDNEMSISPNVGSLSNYFRKIRSSKGYFSFKSGTRRFFSKVPGIGKGILWLLTAIKSGLKKLLVRKNFFECLGLEYIGPVDGHNIESLEMALTEAKLKERITLVHVTTKKGKGFAYAEDAPEKFHGISPFDEETGSTPASKESFSDRFGSIMERLAAEDDKVIAVTAAMCEGTGLVGFREKFPKRFFDVGIAEEHAVTFSSGLALSGYKPVCVLYSTFAQRTFDQIMHDVSIQGLPMVIALDRAGVVPADGITHQGIFDIPLFSTLPDVEIYSPESFSELEEMMEKAVAEYSGIKIIRYPKGTDVKKRTDVTDLGDMEYMGSDAPDAVVLTYGRLTERVVKAADSQKVRVIKIKKVHPISVEDILPLFAGCKNAIFFEEGIRRGGVGESLAARLAEHGICMKVKAIDKYIDHGDTESLLDAAGFGIEEMSAEISNTVK